MNDQRVDINMDDVFAGKLDGVVDKAQWYEDHLYQMSFGMRQDQLIGLIHVAIGHKNVTLLRTRFLTHQWIGSGECSSIVACCDEFDSDDEVIEALVQTFDLTGSHYQQLLSPRFWPIVFANHSGLWGIDTMATMLVRRIFQRGDSKLIGKFVSGKISDWVMLGKLNLCLKESFTCRYEAFEVVWNYCSSLPPSVWDKHGNMSLDIGRFDNPRSIATILRSPHTRINLSIDGLVGPSFKHLDVKRDLEIDWFLLSLIVLGVDLYDLLRIYTRKIYDSGADDFAKRIDKIGSHNRQLVQVLTDRLGRDLTWLVLTYVV